MSKADEMFKKLGYKIDEQDEYIVYWKVAKKQRVNFYNNQNEIQIEFNFNYKTVEKRDRIELDENSHIITMKELQAINKKCEELGWL